MIINTCYKLNTETLNIILSQDDMDAISSQDDIQDEDMSSQDDTQEDEYTAQCKKCDEEYLDKYNAKNKWCKSCQINYLKNNFLSWSGNEKLDNFIQETQLKINGYYDIIFEWIPYDQFDDVKEIKKSYLYLATRKDGSLVYDLDKNKYIRKQNQNIALKYLCGSQNITDEALDEANAYLQNFNHKINITIFGISQIPGTEDYVMVLDDQYCEKCGGLVIDSFFGKWCKSCQINYLKKSFISSGNKDLDDVIREVRLIMDSPYDIVFEWIPYDQFNIIKELTKSDDDTIYLAIWKDGPLVFSEKKWKRDSNKKVDLRFLHNSQNIITHEFLNNEVITYSLRKFCGIHGITQHPDTKDYILVLAEIYCEKCSEKYLGVSNINDRWCLQYQKNWLKENFASWTSGNEKIDNFIQEVQLKILNFIDIVFEWIPYDQFYDIKEVDESGFTTTCLAIWKDGPLEYDFADKKEWIRSSDKKVALKCLNDSQNDVNEFLNEIKQYLTDDLSEMEIYGISQNPDTNDYIMVFQQDECCEKCGEKYLSPEDEWCRPCQINYLENNFLSWSGDERIDNFIREMQLKFNNPDDAVFEWIPYDQFNYTKQIGIGGFATVYLAIWKDGPLVFDDRIDKKEWTRSRNENVALKHLHNSQNISNEFLNEVKAYSNNTHDNILSIHGLSQNPSTKDYIIVLEYAEGRNFNDWMKNNYKYYDWDAKITTLLQIINGLSKIHKNKMVHRDFHTGNILFNDIMTDNDIEIYISDMGLCREVDNTDQTKIYGVMPYLAPEVLKGNPYTEAADIYSLGMIMYFTATGRQPFSNFAHDYHLVSNIFKGIRPKIHDQEAPKYYTDIMIRCWDSNPDNRPNTDELIDWIEAIYHKDDYKIVKQFEEAEEYRKENLSSIKSTDSHPQAFYITRLLNPFTKDLIPDDIDYVDFCSLVEKDEEQDE